MQAWETIIEMGDVTRGKAYEEQGKPKALLICTTVP